MTTGGSTLRQQEAADNVVQALYYASQWEKRLGLGPVEGWGDAHLMLVTASADLFVWPDVVRAAAAAVRKVSEDRDLWAQARSRYGFVSPSASAPGPTSNSSDSIHSSSDARRNSSPRTSSRSALARARSRLRTALARATSSSSSSGTPGSVA
jgi:hypothetical protein